MKRFPETEKDMKKGSVNFCPDKKIDNVFENDFENNLFLFEYICIYIADSVRTFKCFGKEDSKRPCALHSAFPAFSTANNMVHI